MLNALKKHYLLVGALAFIALWATALVFISPQEIINKIGPENAYIIVFLLAVIGGLSTVTGTSFFATTATFANGGADPLLLGLVGGLGIFISDSVFFFLANQGAKILKDEEGSFRWKLFGTIEKVPSWFLGIFVFLYVGLSPLPNDILMIGLALAKVRYRKIFIPILLGSLSIATLTAILGKTLF